MPATAPERGEGVDRYYLGDTWYLVSFQYYPLLPWVLGVNTMPSVGKSTARMLREREEGLRGHLRDITTIYVNVHVVAYLVVYHDDRYEVSN